MKQHKPSVWLVIGDKVGDNRQVELIASALGWPTVRKELRFRPPYDRREGKPPIRPTLDHLDLNRSAPLEPPWPDLILTIGRRPLGAALWLKQRSPKSKLVVVGRPVPAKSLPMVDLMVVPPHYLYPRDPRVLPLLSPLHRLPQEKIEEAKKRWAGRLAPLPRPLVAVMVGGETRPYRFDSKTALDLIEKAKALAGKGTLYFTTSRRTTPEVVETLEQHLPEGALLYRYGRDPAEENPYHALLALAEGCIVTSDSISMALEVLQLGKSLWIYELPIAASPKERLRRYLFNPLLRPFWEIGYRLGLFSAFRDLGQFHRGLYRNGWAAPLGGARSPQPPNGLPDPLEDVVQAIHHLF